MPQVEEQSDALAKVKEEVRRAPRDARFRVHLFQLFCISGEWDRALNQLAVLVELDAATTTMAQAYRAAIRCEMLRERVFAGLRTPTVLGEPAPWMSLLVEANRLLAAGHADDAARLRDAAFDDAPASAGTISMRDAEDATFEWIADADPRLGPVLEAYVEGKYYWIPFERIASVAIESPADLRDLVWMPAEFRWTSGGESPGFIPTRYPGSTATGKDTAMARRTEWADHETWPVGLGQRMFATDHAEYALMDLRRLAFAAS